MAKTSFYSGSGATSNDVDAVDGLKTAAETAKTAAETAQAAAETAESGAETAKSGADTSAANAATSATAAAASAASINSYTGGTGITVSGTTITNDSPDQTVALTAGSNVSVSGTYPNFTISSTGGGSSLTVQDEGSALSTAATTLNFVGNGVAASGTGATKTITVTDTNTTYSVGDGGLTQNNFTNTLKSKLDGIEASATADQTAAEIRTLVESATDSNVFTDADHSKLNGIEASADVTDTANVTAAGALMDSEVTNLAQVKAFDSSDYATAAQGTTADAALPKSGGTMTGNIVMSGSQTVDGRDLSVDGAKLDGIEANATADQTAAEIRTLVESASDSNVFTDADHSKLNAIEANATADQTASEIKTAYESNSDTNAFTDAEKTKLSGVAASANNYVHPNHSGEVTSTADGAMVIADDVVDEANLKVSNSPTNGYVLTAQSGNTGGLTWAAASGGSSGMPTTGGTFTGDVTFEGAQYTNRNVVWDKTDSALEFADNAKIKLGLQSDLQIYHNAQDSYIIANVSGNLFLRNATDDYDVVIECDNGLGGTTDYFRADGSTGEVQISHYGSEKLKTQAGGVDITGDITISGTVDGRDIATNIPSSLGTAGQVLTVNSGASAAEWAAASGGGGADLYAANESSPSAQPSATGGNAVAIGEAPTASGNDSFAVQGGTASGSGALAIGRNVGGGDVSLSRANSTVAIMGSTTTNNHYSTAIGLNSSAQLATVAGSGMGAMALGGSYASGTNSFAAAIATNSSSYGATGANSIAMGYQAKATNSYATVSGGASNVASGYHSTVIGGSSNLADNIGSTVLGGRYGTTRGIRGAAVFGGYGNQITATQGTSQSGLYILAEQTTDATATALKTDNQSSSSTANQIVLPNGGAYAFTGTIVGREAASSGTECAAWRVEGLIRREANAGSTVLVNSSTTVLNNAPSWGMALSADTTNGALAITVTGAAKTIRWAATIQTTELTFA